MKKHSTLKIKLCEISGIFSPKYKIIPIQAN